MSILDILKIYGISEGPEIILSAKEHKTKDGWYDSEQNTITIFLGNKSDNNDTLAHELTHFILFKQGKPFFNHTKKFWSLKNEVQSFNTESHFT